ncbi:TonB-dependent receptor [Panacibacter ginsenosidivorans]|uniref:TonB-dependent receptor n=1 Tax=Panacibacter ginsenosidivorans TaxID=1813871 RepID=A0A5B8VBA8_9BACT|nr:TonB-dependent receptor [Panacibacter ginsenosidivorans]QEC68283.1 TonB-dependent receptor [Panacibacter ginsenosidivorans]
MRIIKMLLAFTLLLCIQTSFAQTVTGKVTDASSGIPLEGVAVKVKSASTGTLTNKQGEFSIKAAATDILVFSFIGYADQEITVGSQTAINVRMASTIADIGQVVTVGTRSGGRIKTESPVPVDVINIHQAGLPTAKMDLTSILNVSAPSFNYNKQSGADGADHIDIGTLRGLGADHTLVLINGKRRHPTAFVGLFGTRGRAGSGVDMNGFPEEEVDRIEILRDGASAQYGSDAIAGVINIVLKKDINHLTIDAGWSGYWDTKNNSRKYNANNDYYSAGALDGNTFSVALNHGVGIGKNGGFINYSGAYRTQGKTYRAAPVSEDFATDKYALPDVNYGRRAFGDGSLTTGGIMYNMEIPTSATRKTSFYSFAGYNYKSSDAFAYTRSWDAKPERYPVNADGSIIMVPSIMHVTGDGSIYYNPHIQTHITDASFAAGMKGSMVSGWNWDLSNSTGYNKFHYFGDKTFNASIIGDASQTHFDDGGFSFLQNATNLDFSKSFKTIAQGMNLGLGAEFRYENYEIFSGEEKSYKGYHPDALYYPNVDESRTPASGSQGFPGFSNTDAVTANRSNIGVYADAELNVTKQWLIDGAVRFENYSDFGSVLTGKFATRFKITDNFNIRGSVSTGFRAPSLAQIHFSNTLTSFSTGALVQSLIAPNTSNIARAAGIPELKQEKSVNASLGFTVRPAPKFTITVDGYLVKMKDRVVLSGLFSKDDETLPEEFTSQFPPDVATAQFFANAVNTTNYGVDLVVDYTHKWGKNNLRFLVAGNFQHINIDKINVPAPLNGTELNRKTFYSDREEAFLKASAPGSKVSLGIDYATGPLGFKVQFTSFGKVVLMGFGDGEAPPGDNPNYSGINPQVPADDGSGYVPEVFNYNHKITTDVSASYKISKNITMFVGADNIFNVHPDLGVNPKAKWWYGDNESGGPWDSVQMGFNGCRVFTKLSFNF